MAATAGVAALPVVAQDSDERAELFAHSDEFRQEVIRVTDGVYVAVGFALGNAILVEGDDGVIIIDTTEGTDAARAIKAEFDRITTKPVAAVVYTHSHPDHIRGTSVFVGDGTAEIYVHEKAGTSSAGRCRSKCGPMRVSVPDSFSEARTGTWSRP